MHFPRNGESRPGAAVTPSRSPANAPPRSHRPPRLTHYYRPDDMTTANFDPSLDLTLVYEGLFSNNPRDPGRATMRGITQSVYDDDREARNLPLVSVRGITTAEIRSIYLKRYWLLVGADRLPIGADYAVFDFAVNSGVGQAAKTLQRVLGFVGTAVDGQVGGKTIAAALDFTSKRGPSAISDSVCAERMIFLRGLPTFDTFGAGWTRRVEGAQLGHQVGDTGVIDRAYSMALGQPVIEPSHAVATVKTYNALALVA